MLKMPLKEKNIHSVLYILYVLCTFAPDFKDKTNKTSRERGLFCIYIQYSRPRQTVGLRAYRTGGL